jgi:DHA1 family tetracycline resistance protein-like MFS transporter
MVSRPHSRMAAPISPQRSSLTIIFTTVFVDLLGFGIVLPLLPYYATEFHASAVTAGALIAVYSAMQFLCAPLWGRWSDRIGRRPVILLSLAGSTLSYLLFALANGVGLLFVSRLLAGVAGANIPVAQAFIADITSEKERARGMGLIGAAFGLGFVFGPAIGGLLAHYGHSAPGLAASAICGVNLLAAFRRLPESLPREHRHQTPSAHPLRQLRDALRRPQLGVLMFLFTTVVFSFATMETTLSLLCATSYAMSAAHIYWLFGYMGLVTTLTQGGLVGRLSGRVDETRLVVIGAALLAVGLGAAPFTAPVAPLLAALGAIAVGQGIASPVLSSLISKSSGSREHGGILGVSQSLGSLARILGPLWGGVLFEYGGPASPYVTTAALMLAATGIAVSLPRRARPAAEAPVELKARR